MPSGRSNLTHTSRWSRETTSVFTGLSPNRGVNTAQSAKSAPHILAIKHVQQQLPFTSTFDRTIWPLWPGPSLHSIIPLSRCLFSVLQSLHLHKQGWSTNECPPREDSRRTCWNVQRIVSATRGGDACRCLEDPRTRSNPQSRSSLSDVGCLHLLPEHWLACCVF
jgi:hypothetical protein